MNPPIHDHEPADSRKENDNNYHRLKEDAGWKIAVYLALWWRHVNGAWFVSALFFLCVFHHNNLVVRRCIAFAHNLADYFSGRNTPFSSAVLWFFTEKPYAQGEVHPFFSADRRDERTSPKAQNASHCWTISILYRISQQSFVSYCCNNLLYVDAVFLHFRSFVPVGFSNQLTIIPLCSVIYVFKFSKGIFQILPIRKPLITPDDSRR